MLKRSEIYILLEDLNFHWTSSEMLTVFDLWVRGRSIFYIQMMTKRNIDEIYVLIMDVKTRIKDGHQLNRSIEKTDPLELTQDFAISLKLFIGTKRKKGFLAFESHPQMNFIFEDAEVGFFRRLWAFGYDIQTIMRRIERTEVEIILLAMDQYRQGKIISRPGILEGWSSHDVEEGSSDEQRIKIS